MQTKVLNNKIAIQIIVIFLGTLLLILGILYATIPQKIIFTGHIAGYGTAKITGNYLNIASIILGVTISAIGFISILIAAIKIFNYNTLIKNIAKDGNNGRQAEITEDEQCNTNFDDMRNKIAYLQQMKTDGLISETDYDEMKTSIIKKVGNSL